MLKGKKRYSKQELSEISKSHFDIYCDSLKYFDLFINGNPINKEDAFVLDRSSHNIRIKQSIISCIKWSKQKIEVAELAEIKLIEKKRRSL